MTSLRGRIAMAFIAIVTLPIILSLWLLWLSTLSTGPSGNALHEVLARQFERREQVQANAVHRLCRDDLAVDRILWQRSSAKQPPFLNADRIFWGIMQRLDFSVLWVIDTTPGQASEIVARGHRGRFLASGTTLTAALEQAGDQGFLYALGEDRSQQLVLHGCSIRRAGVTIAVIGGERLQDLLEIAPDQLELRAGDSTKGTVWQTSTPDGTSSYSFVQRVPDDSPLPYFAILALVSLGFALTMAWWVSRQVSSSLDELTAAAERVGRGELDTTVAEAKHREFRGTATAFNRMTKELRQAEVQLRNAERIAAWRDIAKTLAHELKNPLSPIQMSIETLRKAQSRNLEEFDSVFEESTRTILEEVERLKGIVNEFSRFAQLPQPKLAPTDLRSLVLHVCSLHTGGDVEMSHALPETPVEWNVDREQMTQVLINLAQNAVDSVRHAHPDGGGAVSFTLRRTAGEVEIAVSDNGRGLGENAEKVFDPYFTTKEEGTGLGLAISQRIVSEHGGQLVAAPNEAGGATFTVRLAN